MRQQIEDLRLKQEKIRLKSQIFAEKQKNKTREINNLLKVVETVDDMKAIFGENQSELAQLLNSETGQKLANALIMKFGGGSGEAAGNNLVDMIKKIPKEQKQAIVDDLLSSMKGKK